MANLEKVNNIIRIPTSLNGNFFRIWVEFLTPLHKLTNREKDVVATFIKIRFELASSIKGEALLDKVLMNNDTKARIREECGISDAFFHVILSKLKKNKVIVDGRLNPRFIPRNLKPGDNTFQLLLYFDLDERNSK